MRKKSKPAEPADQPHFSADVGDAVHLEPHADHECDEKQDSADGHDSDCAYSNMSGPPSMGLESETEMALDF